MGSSVDPLVKRNSNCIKNSNNNNCMKEFLQYDEHENIVYYFRNQRNLSRRNIYEIYDIYEKKIGQIEKVNICCETNYTFYDENNQILNYIVKNQNCCETRYTFYGLDKNIESSIRIKSGCCKFTIDEYDKYECQTNGATGTQGCSNFTYYENDHYGNQKFITIIDYKCCDIMLRIYDNDKNEINLNDKTLFNGGFTKIQIILIISILFNDGNNQSNNN